MNGTAGVLGVGARLGMDARIGGGVPPSPIGRRGPACPAWT